MEVLEWVKKQTGKLADNVKDYKFYVKTQPNYVDSSTTMVLTPYTNRDEIENVPCVFRWFRIKNGLLSQVPDFKGNSFICQPSDIGSIIQAEVTSTDPKHTGTAILKYGPVKLDVLIKKQVEHALTSGSLVMNVDLVQKNLVVECQVRVTQENIRITHFNSNNQVAFDYVLGDPRIQAIPKQSNKAVIFFNQRYEHEIVRFTNAVFGFQGQPENQGTQKKVQLKFQNRGMKDSFLLIIKAFNTKKAMKTAAVVNKLQNIDLSDNQIFNYILEIESLRMDLIKLARLNQKYLTDKRIYFEQAKKLETQIEEIINTYTKIVEGKCQNQVELNHSVSYMRDKRDQVLDKKLEALQMENKVLRDRLEYINAELDARGVAHLIAQTPGREQQFLASSRGGFIKKRSVAEGPINPFSILENLKQKEVKEQINSDKLILAKQLNESVRKIAKLELQVEQLKMNNTAMNLDISNISGVSGKSQLGANNKLNLTEMMEPDRKGRDQFLSEIQELKKINKVLMEENAKMREASLSNSKVANQSNESNRSNPNQSNLQASKSFLQVNRQINQVNRSVSYSNRPNIQQHRDQNHTTTQILQISTTSIPPLPIVQSDSQTTIINLQNTIQCLREQNKKLKQQIQILRIQKQIIQKQKSDLQAKYRKKFTQLSSQNQMYKRNNDALNRSQNLSMEMDTFNQERTVMLKKEVDMLMDENSKITNQYKRAMEDLKELNKLREENLRLKTISLGQL